AAAAAAAAAATTAASTATTTSATTTAPKPASAPLTIADFIDDDDVTEIPHIQSNRKSNTLPIWGNQQTMNLNGLVLENVKESYYYKNHLIEIESAQQLLDEVFYKSNRKSNTLPIWGNQQTMNLNGLVLENVKESYYYKNHLIEIESAQQLLDEVFYKVKHLEPWEKGTRKVQGMTGMCGGVRGVGAGGVVSSAFCLLYRFFKVRLTRKQLISMINSRVSPYIRGLGFMYIRYTQPPADLWEWFEPYLDDEEEIDPRSGGGDIMTFGQVVRIMLTKLDWYGTLFPRIPVPIQKEIDEKFAERKRAMLFGDEHVSRREREEERHRRSRSPRDRKRPSSHERKHDEKRPRPTRCGHHLRHHHCTKHRKKCPEKAKRAREEAEAKLAEEQKNKEGAKGNETAEKAKGKERENTAPKQ
ncbi:PRP38 family protein, partial [Oesophagostomum dentatum]